MKPSVRPAIALAAIFSAFLVSCCSPFAPKDESSPLIIMSWNVLSLFDPVDDGYEYSDYSVARGSWSEAKYRIRLEKVAEVVLRARDDGVRGMPGPDILCLVEIEKKSILDDLAKGALSKCGYRWTAFAKAPGSPIGLGILSRRPIESAKAWGLDLGGGRERPILEARFSLGGKAFAVFVNHWKSKLEGAEVTEGSRIESALLLARAMASERAANFGLETIACGDFNESPDEQARVGRRYATAFMPAGQAFGGRGGIALAGRGGLGATSGAGMGFVAFSPWDDSEGYSYVHRGIEERIDGFVLAPGLLDGKGLEYSGFQVLSRGLLDTTGAPIPWSRSTATGWSDHLPILLELSVAATE